MDNILLGEIRIFCGNFAPYQWAFCQGQLLSISQNTALFSLLGTQYGGNGTTNFALPNLQGTIPVHQGSGPGLTPRTVGEQFGSATTTLGINNIPSHTHQITASSANGTTNIPTNNIFAGRGKADNDFTTTAPNVTMNPTVIGVSGSGQPVSNIQPSIALNFIIALQGIFPQRS